MIIKDEYTIERLKVYYPDEMQSQLVVPCDLDPVYLVILATRSSPAQAEGIANCLKIGVEHSADSDPDLAFQLADLIILIGNLRRCGSLVGLGRMAQGDIMAHSGRYAEAWDRLEQAGEIYRQAGDEIGWARTRISRLTISSELSHACVEQAFTDAKKAEAIFLQAERYDRLLRLYHGWAFACVLMGQYEQAVSFYQKAVEALRKQDDPQTSEITIAYLYSDMGYAYNNLGELRTAMHYLSAARQVLLEAGHHFTAAMAEFGMANNHVMRGQYRQALHLLLNSVLTNLTGHRADSAKLTVIECYLALNRNQEAYELAERIVAESRGDPNRNHQTALSAMQLATAQSRLGYLAEAQQSLDLAETNFRAYESMVALIQLRRGQIALRQGDLETARAIGHAGAAQFSAGQQTVNAIDSALLEAEAAMQLNELSTALHLGWQALRQAREQVLLPACYRCYVVLGQILEKQGRRHSSIRMYQAALAVLQRIQRTLTISLRPGFLEDKMLPFHRLMHLYLTGEQVEEAFHTLEQLKSQVFLDYLAQREMLRWIENDQTRPLLDNLRRLRDKYHWLKQLEALPPFEESEANAWYREINSYTSLQQAIVACEQQMRSLIEQLYLFTEVEPPSSADVPRVADIQQCLDDDTALIEFYADRERGWCFVVTSGTITACPLDASITEVQQLVEEKWQSNLDFALQVGPDDPRARVLAAKAQRISEKLYAMLLKPITEQIRGMRRLVIVPYGFLHRFPFNTLRCEQDYLIDSHEIVLLPSASLMLQSNLYRAGGAVVMAHSWNGRLTYSIMEGQMIHQRLGGELYLEQETRRELLHHPPRKVLHISSHGEHRIDQPDFAFIELGDGPVYTDELLQCDLSYELIVLSACEAGQAKVVAGDELIGLGHSLLYAGARSLMTSLWRINEQHTYRLMESLYRALCRGETKAAALRMAQRELLQQNGNLHPAFWAAFQLIGNTEPLSAAS